jgi:hypothetical protein
MPNRRARFLARAAVLAGGIDVLAHRLGISLQTLRRYIQGDAAVPEEIVRRASEVVGDGAVVDPAKSQDTDDKPGNRG